MNRSDARAGSMIGPMTTPPSHSQPLLRQLTLRNLLSFGPQTPPLDLQRLNVMIGPNGSGKSNLIESLALLRAAASDLRAVVRRGGGVGEWVWKGDPMAAASIDAVISGRQGAQPLRHLLAFRAENQSFQLDDERIELIAAEYGNPDADFIYHYNHQHPILSVKGEQRRLEPATVIPDVSILTERKDPEAYPEITYLADVYARIRIYREWSMGRHLIFREPQKADARQDRLEEDFSNLGLFLNHLRRSPKTKNAIINHLKDLYEGLSDFDVSVAGGTVQVFLTEGDFVIPATRLSDGTLRYLCLLAILCDPKPPPLVCIEEPELGLHPDMMPKLARLMLDASERTQLIVTTHSDTLVDALTEYPDALIVCEKRDHQTEMRRLQQPALEEWLKKYSLGTLWRNGELGGNRW